MIISMDESTQQQVGGQFVTEIPVVNFLPTKVTNRIYPPCFLGRVHQLQPARYIARDWLIVVEFLGQLKKSWRPISLPVGQALNESNYTVKNISTFSLSPALHALALA